MCFVYPLGIPAALGLCLWIRRRDIKQRDTPYGDKSLRTLALLFHVYAPNKYYLAPVDMYRRLILSAGLLLSESPAYQNVIAVSTAIVTCVYYRESRPFVDTSMNRVYIACAWNILLGTCNEMGL